MKLMRRVSIRLKREQKKAMILAAAFWAISLLILSGTAFSSGVNAQLKELREQFFACLTIERTLSPYRGTSPDSRR